MEIYNVVVQDPDRVHDDYYYRSRKGLLMKELKARFGELLEIIKVNRGEERFSSKTAAKNSAKTAGECLKFFTPWNSTGIYVRGSQTGDGQPLGHKRRSNIGADVTFLPWNARSKKTFACVSFAASPKSYDQR